MIRFGFITVCLLLGWPVHVLSMEDQFEIQVLVNDGKPSKGQVLVTLFNSPESYMKNPLFSTEADVDSNGSALFSLTDANVRIEIQLKRAKRSD